MHLFYSYLVNKDSAQAPKIHARWKKKDLRRRGRTKAGLYPLIFVYTLSITFRLSQRS